MRRFAFRMASVSVVFLALAGCKTQNGAQVKEGEADTGGAPAEPVGDQSQTEAGLPPGCTVTNFTAGTPLSPADFAKLDDPIAQKVIAGGADCPTTFEKIMDKLRVTDADGCPDTPGAEPSGVVTWMQSDRSQMIGRADSYRYATGRTCSGRTEHDLLISNQTLPAVAPGGQPLASMPQGMTIFGQSKSDRSFNFYQPSSGNTWFFFGNSKDLIKEGYNCNAEGACVPKSAERVVCMACHTGGGLNLMELNLPWTNWTGSTETPGAQDTVTAYHKFLGFKSDAPALERVVTDGNAEWQKSRVAFLKTVSLQEALRPLFCTIDINFQTSRTGTVFSVMSDLYLDPRWGVTDQIPVDNNDYLAVIKANGQFERANTGSPLTGASGKVTDTFFPMIYAERSGMDGLYVSELVSQGVVDEDFVRDVLFVDFTRPTFSPTRCGLLAAAPALSAAQMTPANIREGFKKTLAASADPAAKGLLASLAKPGDQAQHLAEVKKFVAACAARPKAQLIKDAVAYASHTRNAARNTHAANGRGLQVFPETLPFDGLPDARRVFDPTTCALK